nr:retrovirus-related Pol polyprotein from transposon TNT 1-94 [Tanacetum cinerariifolium]
MKGIKREFSVPRTPQQNGIAERKNMTLIEAARTMLADSLLPILFWAKAVNTACYVQNRVLVTKPQNKTPYELLHGKTHSIGFMRPFGYPVTILNTLDPLGKFDEKVNERFLVRYSNIDGDDAFQVKEPKFKGEKPESEVYVSPSSIAQTKKHDDKTKKDAKGKSPVELSTGYRNLSEEFEDFFDNNINEVNAADSPYLAVGPTLKKSSYVDTSQYPDDPNMPKLEDITYSDDEEDIGVAADFTNLETTITVSHIPTTRVHKDHPMTQIIGDLSSATQTRSMTRVVKDQGRLTQINNEDFHTCMFACFLSQEEPKREEGIDYKEVFTLVVRIEAIRLFLAYVSFMGFMVYQMEVKSAFLYGTIEEEVYVCQPLGFEDPNYPKRCTKWSRHYMDYTKLLELDGKSASTPINTKKPLLKDPDVKRIFRYLKGKPHLGLWYLKNLPFNLVAYSDSDYAGASLDRKSTTGVVNSLDADCSLGNARSKQLWPLHPLRL